MEAGKSGVVEALLGQGAQVHIRGKLLQTNPWAEKTLILDIFLLHKLCVNFMTCIFETFRWRNRRNAVAHCVTYRGVSGWEVHQNVAQIRSRHQLGHVRRKDAAPHLGRVRDNSRPQTPSGQWSKPTSDRQQGRNGSAQSLQKVSSASSQGINQPRYQVGR